MSDVPMSDDPVLNDHWTRLSQRACRYLRSKEMFYDNGIPLEERSGSGIFWCSETHKCLGPDNWMVSAEDCGPERTCYEQ